MPAVVVHRIAVDRLTRPGRALGVRLLMPMQRGAERGTRTRDFGIIKH